MLKPREGDICVACRWRIDTENCRKLVFKISARYSPSRRRFSDRRPKLKKQSRSLWRSQEYDLCCHVRVDVVYDDPVQLLGGAVAIALVDDM